MKIRLHRGGLKESMGTVADIEPTKYAVAEYVSSVLHSTERVIPDEVHVDKYGEGIDYRIGWDTHIVSIDGIGVVGFTDGKLQNQ